MNVAVRNPFRPSFGITPPVVAGRQAVVANVGIALREGPGSPYRFALISGARGSGKTVLLNLLEDEARSAEWKVIRVPSSRDMITELRDVALPRLLSELGLREPRTRVTGGSITGIGSVTTETTESAPPRESLRTLLRQVCSVLDEQESGLMLTLDELQASSPDNLHLLTDALQDVVRDDLPIALSVAGLPFEISELLDLPGTTFLRRAMPIPLDPLSDDDVSATLQSTASSAGRPFSPEALSAAASECAGYAYLIQVIGSLAFTLSDPGGITTEHLHRSLPLVRERMGMQVHQPALRGVPERELEYLRAMSQLGAPTATGDIASIMGIPANQQSTYRRRLLERGLIRPHGHGSVDFALPYLGEFLRRTD